MAIDLWVVVVGWMLAGGSPGPATLAITGTSMSLGRRSGVALALGIVAGSASWGIAAGLGMSALMLTHGWVLETVRYIGAAYLFWLAIKSLRSAVRGRIASAVETPRSKLFWKGYAIHLTNPKAILGWGAIYAIALPAGPAIGQVWGLFTILIAASTVTFCWIRLSFFRSRRHVRIPKVGAMVRCRVRDCCSGPQRSRF